MIGIIQKVLMDVVESHGGPEAVLEVKRRASVARSHIYRISEVYADDECRRLFRAATEVLELPEDKLFTIYADFFGRDALQRWPAWFKMAGSARRFIELQPTIHNVFSSGTQDTSARKAVVDKFRVETCSDRLITHYRSPNKFCKLYRALAQWVVNYYGEKIEFEEKCCQLKGASECEIHVVWPQSGA